MQVEEHVQRATQRVADDRQAGLAALNSLFRGGATPDPAPSGRYDGELLVLNLAPGLNWLMDGILSAWMPWKGKVFDPANQSGDNVFDRSFFALAHVFWPLYRGYQEGGPSAYRAFAFRTHIDVGHADRDRRVLKLDYDLPKNPRSSIRRILNELVQISDGFYLGKAHLQWWWGRWQTVGFFTLTKPD